MFCLFALWYLLMTHCSCLLFFYSWLLTLSFWLLALGSWLLVLSSWLLFVCCWFLMVGSWLLTVGSWFFTVGSWFLTEARLIRCHGRQSPGQSPTCCEASHFLWQKQKVNLPDLHGQLARYRKVQVHVWLAHCTSVLASIATNLELTLNQFILGPDYFSIGHT